MFYPDPKNFSDAELINSKLLAKSGATAKRLLCPLLMVSLQQLRNRFGRMVVLNSGLQQRGIRTLAYFETKERPGGGDWQTRAYKAYAESESMHKYGKAIDATMVDTPLAEVHAYIKAHPDEFPFIHFIECDVDWLHFDVRNQPHITFWSPTRGVLDVAKQQPIDWSKLVKI